LILLESVTASLLQLASPALPVGAYTYSQGLEWAVESGRVHDQATRWRGSPRLLEDGVGRFEAPLTACLQRAWAGR
jgi:urease accessory protein